MDIPSLASKQITSDVFHMNGSDIAVPGDDLEHQLHSWVIPAGETMDYYINIATDSSGQNN